MPPHQYAIADIVNSDWQWELCLRKYQNRLGHYDNNSHLMTMVTKAGVGMGGILTRDSRPKDLNDGVHTARADRGDGEHLRPSIRPIMSFPSLHGPPRF